MPKHIVRKNLADYDKLFNAEGDVVTITLVSVSREGELWEGFASWTSKYGLGAFRVGLSIEDDIFLIEYTGVSFTTPPEFTKDHMSFLERGFRSMFPSNTPAPAQ